ncbi:MAG: DUF721 domain-containing protein [Streptosporangiales bacterium]|nr:DUF721 domain-containing protein [Streptosporangiales bacterium]
MSDDVSAEPGPEQLAREALVRVKEAAQRRGARPGSAGGSRDRGQAPAKARPGDPELVGATIGDLLAQRGWNQRVTIASLFARWPELVGAQLAEHCRPRSYDEGKLHVTADSTVWATHLRALAPRLLERLAEELGPNIVQDVRITGPTAPSWRHGPRHVRGRGPRDTYG